MSIQYEEVNKCVEDYFILLLKQGYSVIDIMESFRANPLHADLTSCKFPTEELRRHGQLVSSRYLIADMHKKSRELPAYDPVNIV